ncbi:hypothetical protein DITRI_Ditri04bG0036800 [Diplodiscus trichospermus]
MVHNDFALMQINPIFHTKLVEFDHGHDAAADDDDAAGQCEKSSNLVGICRAIQWEVKWSFKETIIDNELL